ncbi:hypothetical protein [Streptomyces sp. NBC_01429]|uniref:hypothetical protein n=1 Tax=Streptomyces sp. NBC_01429 TaxID=2903862 RepID=UPI002E2A7C4F|nr:hypothetical protein [Streptomyces sp. NBC_01429]
MQLRLRHALVIGVTAATALAPFVLVVHEPAAVAAETDADAGEAAGDEAPRPLCGRQTDRDFPIRARIHDGPDSYPPGGPAGTFSLDLTNVTGAACRDIHPVLVLVDRDRSLSAPDIKLETADARGRWRTLSLERSDEDEIIGVLDDGSPGYDVPAGRTVTVRARLSFGEDARPNEIAVSAATVQRRGAAGDWVGASDAYLFTVGEGGGDRPETSADTEQGAAPSTSKGTGTGTGASAGADTGTKSSPAPTSAPTLTPTPASTTTPGPELATSGLSRGALLGRVVAAVALLAAGAALFIGVRQLRDGPRT